MNKSFLIDNYKNMACAIIAKAAEDYRTAILRRKTLERRNIEETEQAYFTTSKEIYMLEKFFHESEWFAFLPNIEGKYILAKLQEELQ